MKYLFFIILLAGYSFCTGKNPSLACKEFRNGHFIVTLKPEGTRYEVVRTDKYQTEYNPDTDTIVGCKVEWTGDCEYEVTRMNKRKRTITDSSAVQKIFEYRNVAPLKVRIIATHNNYYVFESWKEGINFIYKDTMWRVEAANK